MADGFRLDLQDRLTPGLREALNQVNDRRGLLYKLGRQLETELKTHFDARDSEGNRHGWPRHHFWRRVVKAATALGVYNNDIATVNIASPEFAHKVEGGTIGPKTKDHIAIPISPLAYQIGWPRLYNGPERLFGFVSKRGNYILAIHRRVQVSESYGRVGRKLGVFRAAGKTSGGTQRNSVLYPMWVIKDNVTHAPDRRAWPEQGPIIGRMITSIADWLRARLPGVHG